VLVLGCAVPCVSTVDENEVDYEEEYREYRNDWFVHTDNQINTEETQGSGVEIEGVGVNLNHQGFEPADGPMDSAWPMQGHDVYHSCRSPYSTENNSGVEIWRVRGDGIGAVWGSAILDNDGIIYFGTKGSTMSLYALYPNGTRKWRFIANGAIWVTPTLADNGDIYYTTWGGLGYLQAITKDGTERWHFYQESSSSSAPTIGSDGTIYFGTDGHVIFAVNPNGTQKWRYITSDIVMGSPAIGQDGTIYIGSGDHYLYALYPNGTLRWRFLTGSEIKGSASIAPDGTIYVPSFDGYFYALYPNGTMKWQASTGGSIAAAGIALGEDGTIYVGTEQLRAFYPNGTLKWTTNVQGSVYGTVPAVSADGTIYVSASSSIVAVNPDGTERWRKQLTIAQIRSSPSIGPDDRVYVGSEDYGLSVHGYLHAFGTMENNLPPEMPLIDGPAQIKVKTDVTFTFQATDPDNNPISFFIEWGDNTSQETTDYISGITASFNHAWNQKGNYTIRAKAIDTFGLESDWATFTIKAPLSYEPPHLRFLNLLLHYFPHAFPILRYFLNK
jgi:outer membrane protein assembly factor BamB